MRLGLSVSIVMPMYRRPPPPIDGNLDPETRRDASSSTPPKFSFESATWINTIRASNFEPHVNFGPFFQKGLLSSKRVLQKFEENESCTETLDLQTWSCSFLAHVSPKEAMDLARKCPKFP
jgi:hypothetical protein